nr:MAG TPA: hypothetical protein [Crassvirales sp.]
MFFSKWVFYFIVTKLMNISKLCISFTSNFYTFTFYT